LAQNSALRPVPVRVPEQVLLQVPRPRLGPLSVSAPMPGPVSESVCSREQQGRSYILSH
jgi:hypothetical protein